MKLRLMQILLLIPCCILDGFYLCGIALPLWVVTGINVFDKESNLVWLMELKNGGNK